MEGKSGRLITALFFVLDFSFPVPTAAVPWWAHSSQVDDRQAKTRHQVRPALAAPGSAEFGIGI